MTDFSETYNEFHLCCDTNRFRKILARADLVRMVGDLPGDIVDAGVFKGVSTIQFAHFLDICQPNSRSRVIAFDTFDRSLPGIAEKELKGAEILMENFEDNAFERLQEALRRLGIERRVELVRGDIRETLPRYLEENPGFRISLLHCDLDTYGPTLDTLRTAWPRVVRGGVIAFDEYAVPLWGESDAVDEFLGSLDKPPRLRALTTTPTPSAYCVKE